MAATAFALAAGLPGVAEAQLGALLSPGRLAKAHEKLEGITNCQKCHEQGRKVTAAKCLTCHAPVADRIAKRAGVHKDVKDDCVSCHAEHAGVDGQLRPFNDAQFDHEKVAGFALTGKHALGPQRCAACHKTRSYLTISSACSSCHTDVHKGKFGASCASCHSTSAGFKQFNAQQFDHSKAAFPLTGSHRAVMCASCHTVGGVTIYKGTKFASCSDCHRDPHRSSFGGSCASCHVADAWRTKKIDHAKTAFPLAGRHAAVDCVSCHTQPAMKVKPKADTCATCHADPHKGSFKQDCKACHSEAGWTNAPFDHTQTKFSLTGKHAGLACEKCHARTPSANGMALATSRGPASRPPSGGATARPSAVPGSGSASRPVPGARPVATTRTTDFGGLSMACASCHSDVHDGELGAACETCHTADGFKRPTYSHPRFAEFFGGQHASVTCEKCHQPQVSQPIARPVRTGQPLLAVKYKAATTACASCHKDVHLGQEAAACESCHSVQTAKFAVSNFAHATKTAFPLTGRHESTACAKCHKVETGAFPAGQGTAVRFKGVGKQCAACHDDVHLGQFKDACETCHQTSVFKIPKYSHRNAKKLSGFFVGSHQRAACDACHKPSAGQFPKARGTAIKFAIDAGCVSCHKDVHRGALGADCGSCHHP